MSILGQQKVESYFRYWYQTKICEFSRFTLARQLHLVNINFVFAEISYRKVTFFSVPKYLCMFLRNCVYFGEGEIVRRWLFFLFSTNVHLQRTPFFDVKFTAIFGNQFCKSIFSLFYLISVFFKGLLMRDTLRVLWI